MMVPVEIPYVRPSPRGWIAVCPWHIWESVPCESESDALDRLSAHLVTVHGKSAA